MALRQQIFFTNKQIAERCQQVQPVGAPSQAALADLDVTEDLLDVTERQLVSGYNVLHVGRSGPAAWQTMDTKGISSGP